MFEGNSHIAHETLLNKAGTFSGGYWKGIECGDMLGMHLSLPDLGCKLSRWFFKLAFFVRKELEVDIAQFKTPKEIGLS